MADSMLNPSIRTLLVGNRTMREIKVYPLSTSDEVKMSGLIAKAFMTFADKAKAFESLGVADAASGTLERVEVIKECFSLLVDNIRSVLAIVSDVPEDEIADVVGSMTNPQVMDLVTFIWDDNYEVVRKNAQNLLKKVSGKAAPSV